MPPRYKISHEKLFEMTGFQVVWFLFLAFAFFACFTDWYFLSTDKRR